MANQVSTGPRRIRIITMVRWPPIPLIVAMLIAPELQRLQPLAFVPAGLTGFARAAGPIVVGLAALLFVLSSRTLRKVGSRPGSKCSPKREDADAPSGCARRQAPCHAVCSSPRSAATSIATSTSASRKPRSRGIDVFNGAYQILDLTPKGRDEGDAVDPMFWLNRHDQSADSA